ncbi:putative nuclease HARBI1 [Choanephora cucurbitarum]|uniref:Putative nuclease HARBI1 n=1 Tax=Choanephora cucurbitarum TaxID=101091 RepID=A0A1C7NCA7_9FUNG|nr:putative nuclease HARBI1 [Choanephora cucurbitarum]
MSSRQLKNIKDMLKMYLAISKDLIDIERTGSVFGRRFIHRDRVELDQRLNGDYFNHGCRFPEELFRRFKELFLRIEAGVLEADTKFALLKDARGLPQASTRQKVASGIRLLAKGSDFDAMDEYFGMSESKFADYFVRFPKAIIKSFGDEYLRKPNADDGQYLNRKGKATMVLEAVASYDLWIWHYNFGSPGSLNDLNFLSNSNLFDDWIAGTISDPPADAPKLVNFVIRQETVRKDVERAFGVLQGRFKILANGAKSWDQYHQHLIRKACIIIHNTIVEERRPNKSDFDLDPSVLLSFVEESLSTTTTTRARRVQMIQSKIIHDKLKNDLIETCYEYKLKHQE